MVLCGSRSYWPLPIIIRSRRRNLRLQNCFPRFCDLQQQQVPAGVFFLLLLIMSRMLWVAAMHHSVKHYETEVFNVCAILLLFPTAKIPLFSKWKWYYWQICERFASFPSTQKKFYLFLPLPFREKSERPEKAHSSLYSLTVNLANSFWRTGIFEKVVFSLLCYCINANNINSGALPLFIIYCSSGRLDPTVNNKDKFVRLRSVAVFKTAHSSQRAKMVSDYAKHQD